MAEDRNLVTSGLKNSKQWMKVKTITGKNLRRMQKSKVLKTTRKASDNSGTKQTFLCILIGHLLSVIHFSLQYVQYA